MEKKTQRVSANSLFNLFTIISKMPTVYVVYEIEQTEGGYTTVVRHKLLTP